MAPRKNTASSGDESPRRSGRSSTVKASTESQSAADEKAAKSASRKRKAGGDGDDKPAKNTKKAKAVEEKSEMEKEPAQEGDEKEKPEAEAEAEEKGAEEEPAAVEAEKPAAADEKPAAQNDKNEKELAAIDIGDSLPSITLKNEKDEDLDVSTLTADQGLVLFLVPKADTPGCTTQACGFRDAYPDFTGLGYGVYCLSADKPAAQSKWQTKKELPYPLLSDPKRVLITALDAGDGGKTKRSHFVFGKGGKLLEKKMPVKPADSPKLALEFIKSQSS